jgi:hypothetical protein
VLREWEYGQAAIDMMKMSEPWEYVSRANLDILEAFVMCINNSVNAV